MNFTWEVPTRIHFGTNICAEAMAKEKDSIQGRNVLLVYTGHTLKDNGTLLLAPYRKTGAILGFVKYAELPRLNDIIRAIASFNDDQVDSLPEGFILFK